MAKGFHRGAVCAFDFQNRVDARGGRDGVEQGSGGKVDRCRLAEDRGQRGRNGRDGKLGLRLAGLIDDPVITAGGSHNGHVPATDARHLFQGGLHLRGRSPRGEQGRGRCDRAECSGVSREGSYCGRGRRGRCAKGRARGNGRDKQGCSVGKSGRGRESGKDKRLKKSESVIARGGEDSFGDSADRDGAKREGQCEGSLIGGRNKGQGLLLVGRCAARHGLRDRGRDRWGRVRPSVLRHIGRPALRWRCADSKLYRAGRVIQRLVKAGRRDGGCPLDEVKLIRGVVALEEKIERGLESAVQARDKPTLLYVEVKCARHPAAGRMSKGRRLVLIGAITASRQTLAGGGMGLVGASVERSLGLGGVVAALKAVKAVANPRLAAIPAKGTYELSSITSSGLVKTGHSTTSQT